MVLSALRCNRFPIVLAGNCNSCVGTIAGIDSKQLGIIWFDAHGDFYTPETTMTGFLDGMGLAMATGRCWKPLLGTIHNFNPVPENCIIHVGSQDLDPEERKMLIDAKIPLLRANPKDEYGILSVLKDTLIKLKSILELWDVRSHLMIRNSMKVIVFSMPVSESLKQLLRLEINRHCR